VRPDTIAFRELDTLVRNLSDQLAGYRRRALSAESRSRELEQLVAERDGTLIEVRADGLRSTQARALLEAKVRELEAKAELAQAEVVRVRAAFAAAAEAATPQAVDSELARENERLRARLSEAGEKTAQLGERVRFLRQQIGQGAER
jgi:phosphoglycolate phosphatase-like HAD superfamily hydrolase